LRRFGALAVDDGSGRTGLAPSLFAHRNVKRMVDALQRAVPIPQLEIMMHRAFRREILGKGLPLASGPKHTEQAVENFADVHIPRPTAASRRRYHRRDQRPLVIGEITCITQTSTPCRYTMFRCAHRALLQKANQRPTRNHNRLIGFNKFLDGLLEPFRPRKNFVPRPEKCLYPLTVYDIAPTTVWRSGTRGRWTSPIDFLTTNQKQQ